MQFSVHGKYAAIWHSGEKKGRCVTMFNRATSKVLVWVFDPETTQIDWAI